MQYFCLNLHAKNTQPFPAPPPFFPPVSKGKLIRETKLDLYSEISFEGHRKGDVTEYLLKT